MSRWDGKVVNRRDDLRRRTLTGRIVCLAPAKAAKDRAPTRYIPQLGIYRKVEIQSYVWSIGERRNDGERWIDGTGCCSAGGLHGPADREAATGRDRGRVPIGGGAA